jgi:cellulose synthase/poly-beta-1,6-N-acetylglucosamine synthase-like glycosyltransferase
MLVFQHILFCLYILALIGIVIYASVQLFLLIYTIINRNMHIENLKMDFDNLPFVTIQLPIYNEKLVIERLIDNIMKMDYPTPNFEVQILDDSNDGSQDIIKNKVQYYTNLGYNIKHMPRQKRIGFKAGALAYGLETARGEFIAIFDADFLPSNDFLMKSLPYFYNDRIAVVQSRWGHLNENYSLLTKIQAMQLNVHFIVEQMGRFSSDKFLQFNGTSGIWRKDIITIAGGWQHDTLTEDLDLSIRAQLKGYKIVYLTDNVTNAELPISMSGVKSQQYRWMKGGAENAKKLNAYVLDANISFAKKLNTLIHLYNSSIFVMVMILGLSNLVLTNYFRNISYPFVLILVPLLSTGIIFLTYLYSNLKNQLNFSKLIQTIIMFPLVLITSMGLSLHNSIAVLEGWAGIKTDFIRTPKFNSIGKTGINTSNNPNFSSWIFWSEGVLACLFLLNAYQNFLQNNIPTTVIQSMFGFGFLMVFVLSIKEK